MNDEFKAIGVGYDPNPAASMSLHAAAYTEPRWFEVDQRAIFARSWQWPCFVETLREPGSYVSDTVAGMPIVAGSAARCVRAVPRLRAAVATSPEMASLNVGSMNFGIFPMLEKHSQWKHGATQGRGSAPEARQ